MTQLSDVDLQTLRRIAAEDAPIVHARDWDALAARYAPDAVRQPPNAPPIEGREAIREWLEALPPIDAFEFRAVDIDGAGEVAYMRGAWSLTLAPPGAEPVSDAGSTLIVFRK